MSTQVRFERWARWALPALLCARLAWAAPPLSDALKAPRPKGGEYFGLYLVDKKVGYIFQDLEVDPAKPAQALFTMRMFFKASVGGKVSERAHEAAISR